MDCICTCLTFLYQICVWHSKKSRMTYDMEGLLNEDIVASPILFDIIKRNIATNSSALDIQPELCELEWGPSNASQIDKLISSRPLDRCHDMIIGSDLTYHSSTASALFWTVSKLLKDMTQKRDDLRLLRSSKDSEDSESDEEDWEESKIKFITAHEHRLDLSTKETLNVAVNKYRLQHEELYVSPDRKHSVWMFNLRD